MYVFEKKAEQGDAVAQFCLAFMYIHGKGVLPDIQKAIEWYTKATEQGFVPAQNDLGVTFGRLAEKLVAMNSEVESEFTPQNPLSGFKRQLNRIIHPHNTILPH